MFGYIFLFVTVGLSGENVAMESILPIVASQRERFKIRNMKLEAVSNRLELMLMLLLLFVFANA